MTPKQYIKLCLRTEPLHKMHCRLEHALIGMATEAGEALDNYKKYNFYEAPFDKTNLLEECGDLLWYMSLLLTFLDSNYEEVMKMNIAKLKTRYPERFTKIHALRRNLKKERRTLVRRNRRNH